MNRVHVDLTGVPETLLIPLYCRAVENQRSDALIQDKRAAELMSRIDFDFSRIKFSAADQLFTIMRVREFDQRARAFVAAHPDGIVVSIGCGLDTRFERVDNGSVEWYDLDLPEVIALRRQLVAETPRCHFVACSVLDFAWMDVVGDAKRPYLFLAEGVFPYFAEADVRRLVLALQARFPGAEVVFDAMTPFVAWAHSRHPAISKLHTNLWGLRRSQELETWSPGICLLDEWFYFDRPEPRLGAAGLMRFMPLLSRGNGIVQYRLGVGEPAD